MWSFTWILGVTAALGLAVTNVMWYEFRNEFEPDDSKPKSRSQKR